MKRFIFVLFFIFLLIPISTQAGKCGSNSSTVIYVNGIFTSESEAVEDKELLRRYFLSKSDTKNVNFVNGYNESHCAGVCDVLKSITQAYSGASLDYDLREILRQVHDELSTRKVLLVGHSQGTFYTNAAYDYLIDEGQVSKESISVYNIATPADRVAGDGNYLTSSTDKLINRVRELIDISSARKPLPANITIPISEEENNKEFGGHSFSGVYLPGAPDRIIGDIQKQLNSLSVKNEPSETDGCFTPPPSTLTHKLRGAGLAILDKTAGTIASSYNLAGKGLAFIYNSFKQLVLKINQVLLAKTGLFGAALTNTFPADSSQTTANPRPAQPPPVITQTVKPPPPPPPVSQQDIIDDMLEKIDLIQRQLNDLAQAEKLKNQAQNNSEKNQVVLASQTNYSGGSKSKPNYPKILISEIQLAGTGDEKKEFVELYNPNSADADLTSWYLQRKTKTGSDYSTFAPNNLFSGKIISSNNYFLIAREGYFSNLADISVDNPLTNDNSLFLKNPNGDIVDKVGWGQAQEYESTPTQSPIADQSIGRKSGQQDTDNNSVDFELNEPTPRAQNKAYQPPLQQPPAGDTKAPEVVFDVKAIEDNLNFTINFTIEDPIGTTSPSGLDIYTFRWKEETNNWQEDSVKDVNGSPATFSGTRDFTGNDEKNYYFQIKAKDTAGNESDWLPETPATTKISLPKKVLINEIQIDSVKGKGGVDDDWVELHNPNDVDVSLNGWSIQKHSKSDPCSIDKSFDRKSFDDDAKILAKGFFLIADTQANESLKSIADMTIGWTLSDDNTIYLVRSKDNIADGQDANIVDKVGFGGKSCFPENSPALNPPEEKSIERKKLGLDTDNNSADFKVSDEPSPKATFPFSTIKDATDYSVNAGANSNPGAPVYNILIKWQSASQDIDFFQVQYKLNDSDWKDWLSQASQTQEYFQVIYSLFEETVYYFRVRTQDKEGNLGSWSSEIKVDLTNPVVINELAYAGTNADSKDQWLELYNTTDKDVDLTGWKIVSGPGNNKKTIELEGVIGAKEYFILERNDDKTLSDITANQIFKDKIEPNNISLRAPNNRYVDELRPSNSALSEGGFIIDNNRHSMERVSAFSFGILLGSSHRNWKLNDGQTINGLDRDKNKVYGTPGHKNSLDQLYTYYPFSFIEDETLKKELSPYLFEGDVQVFKNVNLTIEPGVVIKFYDGSSKLTINGNLKAAGENSDKIVFTSFRDDEHGGNSNKNSGASQEVGPGSWLGLHFDKDSKSSELDNVIVRYGGAVVGSSPPGWGNAIWVDQGLISLSNSILEKNRNRGLRLVNSPSKIDSVNFWEHNTTDWPSPDGSKAISIEGGKPEIKNSFFKNNYYGIYIGNWHNNQTNEDILGEPVLENNQFEGNAVDVFNVNPPPPPPPPPE